MLERMLCRSLSCMGAELWPAPPGAGAGTGTGGELLSVEGVGAYTGTEGELHLVEGSRAYLWGRLLQAQW